MTELDIRIYNAFHDCGSLTSITILNDENNVNIDQEAFAFAGTLFQGHYSKVKACGMI